MLFRRLSLAASIVGALASTGFAQSAENSPAGLLVELNAVRDVDGACQLSFLIQNGTGTDIESAKFETVIFDADNRVLSLTLLDFRDLPADRPRVRQFNLAGLSCASVGQALINGASTCIVGGSESGICQQGLRLRSRVEMELLG